MRVRVHRDIHDVPADEWDRLVPPEEIQMSHRFVRVCQESGVERAAYRHVLIHDDRGLCAIASLSAMQVRLDLLAPRLTRAPVRIVRRLYPSFLVVPVLFCGLPVSFGRPCLRLRADADRRRVLEALGRVMDYTGRELGARLLCFKEFAPEESAGIAGLDALGYFRAPSLPSCGLRIRWPSWETYRDALRAGYRHQLLRARAHAEAAGVRFRTADGHAVGDAAIFHLYEQVMDRAEFQLERLNAEFFRRLSTILGEACSVIVAERHGAPVAVAILLRGGARLAFLLAGIDYREHRASGAYVALLGEIVATAIREGATYLELGQTSYALKTRFGAEEVPRDLYLKGTTSGVHRLLHAGARMLFPTLPPTRRHVFRRDPALNPLPPAPAFRL